MQAKLLLTLHLRRSVTEPNHVCATHTRFLSKRIKSRRTSERPAHQKEAAQTRSPNPDWVGRLLSVSVRLLSRHTPFNAAEEEFLALWLQMERSDPPDLQPELQQR